ncbi:MAG TPA: hypothetical protein VGO47_12170 [Chlamydiales bacterium]|nr:hypothetical protein [Chlamydiales bacterium]
MDDWIRRDQVSRRIYTATNKWAKYMIDILRTLGSVMSNHYSMPVYPKPFEMWTPQHQAMTTPLNALWALTWVLES